MMRFLKFPPEKIQQALASWQWLAVVGKQPFLVTAFGDVFLRDTDGIHFLDTIEGTLEFVCKTDAELERILDSEETAERFLLASLLAEAERRGITLASNECLNFGLDPVVGGAIDISNVVAQDFVVAVNVAGQLHSQTRNLAAGTPLAFKTVE